MKVCPSVSLHTLVVRTISNIDMSLTVHANKDDRSASLIRIIGHSHTYPTDRRCAVCDCSASQILGLQVRGATNA